MWLPYVMFPRPAKFSDAVSDIRLCSWLGRLGSFQAIKDVLQNFERVQLSLLLCAPQNFEQVQLSLLLCTPDAD